jgi:PAS domain S-box-containing protein
VSLTLGGRFALLREKALSLLEARTTGNTAREASVQQELEVLQTELELQQEELVESQRRAAETAAYYRQLFFESPLPLVLLDPLAAVKELNRRAEKLLGVSQGRCFGVDFKQFVSSDELEWWSSLLRRAEQESFTAELQVRQLGGAKRRCLVSVARRGDGLMLMLDDITSLRHAEEQRRIADERLTRVLDDSHDAVLFYDAATFLVTRVNDTFCRKVGLTSELLLGRALFSLFAEEDVARQELVLKQAAASTRPTTGVPLKFVTAAGPRFHAEATVGRLHEGGAAFTTLLLRDVSPAPVLDDVLGAVVELAEAPPTATREELARRLEEIRAAAARERKLATT